MAVVVIAVGQSACSERLSNPEGQEILVAAIVATGSTLFTASNVLLAAPVTATEKDDTAAKALKRIEMEIGKATASTSISFERRLCPCGGQCDCGGCADAAQKPARETCVQNLASLVDTFQAGCPKPTIAQSALGRWLVVDLGPHCQGCAIAGRRLGGRTTIDVKSDTAPWVIEFDSSEWLAADRFTFAVKGSYEIDPACFRPPANGLRGDRFDHRGKLVATLSEDAQEIVLAYTGMTRVDHANRLTHANVTTGGDNPLTVRLLDPDRGVKGGVLVRGIETWTTGEGNSKWTVRIQDAVMQPGRPVPRSGAFVIDAPPNRTDIRLEFAAVGAVTEVTLVGVSRVFRFNVMPGDLVGTGIN